MNVKSYKGTTYTEVPRETAEVLLPRINERVRAVNAGALWKWGEVHFTQDWCDVEPSGYHVWSDDHFIVQVSRWNRYDREKHQYRELTMDMVRVVWRVAPTATEAA